MDHSAQGSRQQGILRCKYILLLSSFSLPSLVPFFFYSRIALATVDTNMCSFLCYSITCDRSRWKMGCRLGIHERAAIPTRKKKKLMDETTWTHSTPEGPNLYLNVVSLYTCVCVCCLTDDVGRFSFFPFKTCTFFSVIHLCIAFNVHTERWSSRFLIGPSQLVRHVTRQTHLLQRLPRSSFWWNYNLNFEFPAYINDFFLSIRRHIARIELRSLQIQIAQKMRRQSH